MDSSCRSNIVQAGDSYVLVWAVFSWSSLRPLVELWYVFTNETYTYLDLADR